MHVTNVVCNVRKKGSKSDVIFSSETGISSQTA
jgi:hypothetical protein